MASYTTVDYEEAEADEFSIFHRPRTFTAVEKLYYVNYRPTSQITTDSSPVEFNISGQGIDYIDLSRTKLHVKAKITTADGTNTKESENVSPINLWLHSLWSQIDISLNGKLITSSSNLYPYKSMINVLLNEPTSALGSVLQSQLYYKDSSGIMDAIEPLGSGQMGLFKRYHMSKLSQTVDMEGTLRQDFMDVKRYLINGVNLQIKMFPTRPSFNLMSGTENTDYKVQIEDVFIKVCKVRPNVSIITSHAKVLDHSTAMYPFTKRDVKVSAIPKGQLSFHWDHMFQDKSPNTVVVALVSAEAMNGNYAKNPFNFAIYDLSNIALYVNGEALPAQPLRISNGQYITAYNSLFEGRESIGSDITRSDFDGGYALFRFTLEPTHLKENYLDLLKKANLRLELNFAKPLPETVNCLVYSEDNLLLEIDQARNVIYTST